MHFCLSICHCYCFTLASKPRQWYICLSKLVIFNKLCLKYIIHKHYVCLQMNLVSILLNSLNIFKSCTAIKTVISYVLRSCGCIASDKIRKKGSRRLSMRHLIILFDAPWWPGDRQHLTAYQLGNINILLIPCIITVARCPNFSISLTFSV